jgi:hypothetical protein
MNPSERAEAVQEAIEAGVQPLTPEQTTAAIENFRAAQAPEAEQAPATPEALPAPDAPAAETPPADTRIGLTPVSQRSQVTEAPATSWIVVDRETGDAVTELFDPQQVGALAPRFQAVDAREYLARINAAIKQNGGTEQGLDLNAVRRELVRPEAPEAPPVETATPATPVPEAPTPPDTAPAAQAPLADGTTVMLRPSTILARPKEFQFKGGGDEFGVTGTLSGVKRWDNNASGISLVWQDLSGRLFIVDGHQRLGLAKRLEAEGQQNVLIRAIILREADGVTAEQAMLLGAVKNLQEGGESTSSVDVAKVMRRGGMEKVADVIPPSRKAYKDGMALAKLGEEAFGMVINEVVPANYAAEVGRVIEGDAAQVAALNYMAQKPPANANEARLVAMQMRAEGFATDTQESLFGDMEVALPLFSERAKILTNATTYLKSLGRVFKTAINSEAVLSQAGNVLDADANAKNLTENQRLAFALEQLSSRKGPISDALTEQAGRLARGEVTPAKAREAFLEAVRQSDGGTSEAVVQVRGRPVGDGAAAEAGQVRADTPREQAPEVTTEQTPEGEQAVIPGAERVTQGEARAATEGQRNQAEADVRQQQSRMRGDNTGDAGPLFDDQDDMFAPRSRPQGEATPAASGERQAAAQGGGPKRGEIGQQDDGPLFARRSSLPKITQEMRDRSEFNPGDEFYAATSDQFSMIGMTDEQVEEIADAYEQYLFESSPEQADLLRADLDRQADEVVKQRLADLRGDATQPVSLAKERLKRELARQPGGVVGALQSEARFDALAMNMAGGALSFSAFDERVMYVRERAMWDDPESLLAKTVLMAADLETVDVASDTLGDWAIAERAVRNALRKAGIGPVPAPGEAANQTEQPDGSQFARSVDMFYSPLYRAVSEAKQKSATAADWKNILPKLPGVKKAELDWIDVDGWLDTQEGQVSREALLDFIRSNGIELVEDVQAGREVDDADYRSDYSHYVDYDSPIIPDGDYLSDLAEDYYDEARDQLEEEYGGDAEISDGEIRARAKEIAREQYEPTEFKVVFTDSRDRGPEIEGTYNNETGMVYVSELGGDEYPVRRMDALLDDWAFEEYGRLDMERENPRPDEVSGPAAFEEYTEDGGKNYREILLRVPNLDETGRNRLPPLDTSEADRIQSEMNAIVSAAGVDTSSELPAADFERWSALQRQRNDAALAARAARRQEKPKRRPFVKANHFEQENIVVHARVKDRVDRDGKRILFIEEIQSDLASEWRDNTESPEVTARREELRQEVERANREQMAARDALWSEWQKNGGEDVRIANMAQPTDGGPQTYGMIAEGVPLVRYLRAALEWDADQISMYQTLGSEEGFVTVAEAAGALLWRKKALRDAVRAEVEAVDRSRLVQQELAALGPERRMDPNIPETPFLGEASYALMVKRLMRMAAEEGYDGIAWTPGYMQAERWNKAAQSVAEGVSWSAGEGEFSGHRYVDIQMADGGRTVTAVADESGVIYASATYKDLEGKKLSTLLGPGLAKQIMSEESGSVTGEKITFGDSGYAIAYDQQVKRAVEKFSKKYGTLVKVDRTLPDFNDVGATNDARNDAIASVGPVRFLDEVLAQAEREGRRVIPEVLERARKLAAEAQASLDAGTTLSDIDTWSKVDALRQLAGKEGTGNALDALGANVEASKPVWRIDFNDKMRDAALEAQPLFRQTEQAAPGVDQFAVTPMFSGLASTVQAKLDARMEKLGVKGIGLNIVQSLGGTMEDGQQFTADGMFWRGVITVALDSEMTGRGAVKTFNHEVIHGFRSERLWGREHGLFRKAEWDTLRRAALADTERMADVQERYPDLTFEQQIEEAIADMFGDWAAGRMEVSGFIKAAFERIRDFIEGLGRVLRGEGFENADMVFKKIERGDVEAGLAEVDAQFGTSRSRGRLRPGFGAKCRLREGFEVGDFKGKNADIEGVARADRAWPM